MKKIKDFIQNNIWKIMFISLILLVVSCCIIGILELSPIWYVLSGILGLGVLIPFICIVGYSFIVVPFLKLRDKIRKK